MKTKLIYLEDSYLKELESEVIEVEIVNEKLAKIILKETIFYPEGGGQPSDQGLISIDDNNFRVKQVRLEGGEVKLYLDIKERKPKTGKCYMEIDWKRRYHNMKVHSAGHIIDWAISELKVHNDELTPSKGNHGKNASLKYLGKSDKLEKSDLQKRVNKILNNSLDIKTEMVTLEELEKEALYTFPNLPKDKPLRIIRLEGYKPVPDGGTQVKNTSEIDSIVIEEIKTSKLETKIKYEIKESLNDKEDKSSDERENYSKEDEEKLFKKLEELDKKALEEIKSASTLKMLEKQKSKYLGKKSELITILRGLKDLPYDIRSDIGKKANILKNKIQEYLDNAIAEIEEKKIIQEVNSSWLDVTEPAIKPKLGTVHPTTQMMWKATDVFESMGFEIIEPTEIDNDYNHFTALNIPEEHPARDMWDTFWTETDQIAIAHTSTMQNRILSQLKPPIRAIVPGRCFRNEATDSSHEHTFYQIEGVYLDENINLSHLISTLKTFLEKFFERDIRIKIQPTYFPFVEPAIEIMMERPGYKKPSDKKYDNDEWLEVIPCGPIHPNVLKEAGIDPNKYSGFAWGFGLDRITMVKYEIDDIRHFHSGDLRFLNQFK